MWAISKALGSWNGRSQIWKSPIAHRTFAQKWYMANLGVSLAGQINDLLDSRAEAVLHFWLYRHLRCRTLSDLRRCYWKRCFANLFFPAPSMDSQLVGQPPLHSHSYSELSSFPGVQAWMLWRLPAFWAPTGPNLCQKECQIECQSIYIYISICLSAWLAG